MKKIHFFLFLAGLFLATGCLDPEREILAQNAFDPSGGYLYANGEPIGEILGYGDSIEVEFNKSFEPIEVWANGKIKDRLRIEFSDPDCKGEAYVYFGSDEADFPGFRLKRAKGKVFPCDASACGASLYYLPPNEEFYWNIAAASVYSVGSCLNLTQTAEWHYYKVYPNNFVITGIREYPFPLSLTFEGIEQLKLKLAN
jgi:hypothetical protein